ncbi:Abi family protein [uncultured Sneathiella sp.]|uniref:Abi family protein n=1 Tax=uncultured Sneathiella sp. TaxID=879315 RepID=UPI0030DCE84F|tara:strand:- start:793 stop:1443 length:651 start_codon:yes stop_codon:yes gene_type:complete
MRNHDGIEAALSLERFSRYMEWAGGDRERAVDLYTLNSRISESLYIAMQMLEVALRNSIHSVMSEKYSPDWMIGTDVLKTDMQIERVSEATQGLQEARKEITPDKVVAALSFGFWTTMLNNDYETLWQQGLYKIVLLENGRGTTRKKLSTPLTPIRILRNRVAHHEPILHWNLNKHYSSMCKITKWLSSPASEWCREHSRFPSVCPRERVDLIRDE